MAKDEWESEDIAEHDWIDEGVKESGDLALSNVQFVWYVEEKK